MNARHYIAPVLYSEKIAHGFFGREGGVSEGIYAGLNCGPGSGDNKEAVEKNRTLAALALQAIPDKLCTLYQIHSPTVLTVEEPWGAQRPQADGMVTNKKGIVLGILTADCAPVLFCDREAGVIGAAHAGWKGAMGGVIENTVAAMEALGANRNNIRAAIGPCIAQESYEVGEEFHAKFLQETAKNAEFFEESARAGHYQFDLVGYVGGHLVALGLQHLGLIAMDTCADEARFFSYRRAVLKGEKEYGRQLSAIVMKEDV